MTLAFALGLSLRFVLHANPDNRGIFTVEDLFVLLPPCGFIAANYVLLGRTSRWLQGEKHLFISPQRITMVFVLSDVVTFLVQVSVQDTSVGARILSTTFRQPVVQRQRQRTPRQLKLAHTYAVHFVSRAGINIPNRFFSPAYPYNWPPSSSLWPCTDVSFGGCANTSLTLGHETTDYPGGRTGGASQAR